MIGVTVWPVGTTMLIGCTDKPGVSITGGVTTTCEPDIVVVYGGGRIGLMGVGGG
jgi:hypothetical protein